MEDGWSVIITPCGDEEWYKHDKLHMDGGNPAIKRINGDKEWWVDGKRHRGDGPAIITNEIEVWYRDGMTHRGHGPAFIRHKPTKTQEWWINGELHREDGPAVIDEHQEMWCTNGLLHRIDGPERIIKHESGGVTKIWYLYGMLHRDNGAAIEDVYNKKYWYIYDHEVTEEIYNLYLKNQRKIAFKYFHKWYECLDDLSRPIGRKRMIQSIENIMNN